MSVNVQCAFEHGSMENFLFGKRHTSCEEPFETFCKMALCSSTWIVQAYIQAYMQ